MEVVYTNFSNQLYVGSRNRANEAALKHGIKKVVSYDFNDIIDTDFYRQNEKILSHPKTLGYWLWKPYIITEIMKTLAEGDIVIYLDAGAEVIASLDPLIEICNTLSPVMLFGNCNDININWVKRDCFVLMGCDSPEYWYAPHCDAALCIFKKCEYTENFLTDWLTYATDERIITDNPNTCGKNNLPEFNSHRMDQSILALLSQKYKIDYHRMPTQFGNHYKQFSVRVKGEFNCINQTDLGQRDFYATVPYYNSPYGQLINHHRSKVVTEAERLAAEAALNVKPKRPSVLTLMKWGAIKVLRKSLSIIENQ